MRMKVVLSHLALRALGVSVEELRHVGHDGLLVRPLDVHVLRVQQPRVARSVGRRIRIFLRLQDPDPLVRGVDPDPLVRGADPDPGSISQRCGFGTGSFLCFEIMLAKRKILAKN